MAGGLVMAIVIKRKEEPAQVTQPEVKVKKLTFGIKKPAPPQAPTQPKIEIPPSTREVTEVIHEPKADEAAMAMGLTDTPKPKVSIKKTYGGFSVGQRVRLINILNWWSKLYKDGDAGEIVGHWPAVMEATGDDRYGLFEVLLDETGKKHLFRIYEIEAA